MPKPKSVDEFIDALDAQKRPLADELRMVVKKALPDAEEKLKWGNITYTYNGSDICWIIAYKDHLDFGFFKGAMLKSDRLEGTGKGLRHIKVSAMSDIDEAEFTRLIGDATKLAGR